MTRLAIVVATGLVLSAIASIKDHEYYWNKTIKNVQTVDLNLLFHFAPHKLSTTLIQNHPAELQRTLDSNYGLFGIVVTNCKQPTRDCPDQAILYSSTSDHQWKKELHVENLLQHPFDHLRNPAPLAVEQQFAGAKNHLIVPTEQQNRGEIIGRVYYVRGIPPTFWQDYQKWLTKLDSDSGSHRSYRTTTLIFLLGSLLSWLGIETFLRRKQAHFEAERHLFESERNQLIKEIEKICADLELERSQQNDEWKMLLQQREKLQEDLAREQSQSAERQEQLGKEIDCLQLESIQQIQVREQLHQEIIAFQERQRAIQQQLEIKKSEAQHLQDTLQQRDQVIINFENHKRQISEREVSNAKNRHEANENLKKLKKAQERIHSLRSSLESDKIDYDNQICQLEAEIQRLQVQYSQLEQDNDKLQGEYADLESNSITLEKSKASLKDRKIAIIGGHERAVNHVYDNLRKYGLNQELLHIPPSSRKSISESEVKSKIAQYELLIVVTSYIGHDLYNIVTGLGDKRALAGQLLPISKRGATGITQEIIAYFQKNNLK
jgi:hypothetical protein